MQGQKTRVSLLVDLNEPVHDLMLEALDSETMDEERLIELSILQFLSRHPIAAVAARAKVLLLESMLEGS